MPVSEDSTEALIAKAQALIDRVQAELAAGDDFFRSQGVSPEKYHEAMARQLTPHDIASALQSQQADMEEIEQEVREEALRRSFTRIATSSSARRRRPMI